MGSRDLMDSVLQRLSALLDAVLLRTGRFARSSGQSTIQLASAAPAPAEAAPPGHSMDPDTRDSPLLPLGASAMPANQKQGSSAWAVFTAAQDKRAPGGSGDGGSGGKQQQPTASPVALLLSASLGTGSFGRSSNNSDSHSNAMMHSQLQLQRATIDVLTRQLEQAQQLLQTLQPAGQQQLQLVEAQDAEGVLPLARGRAEPAAVEVAGGGARAEPVDPPSPGQAAVSPRESAAL